MKKEAYIRSEEMSDRLNQLLSNYQVYYQNLRAFHWLVTGPQFYQLHSLFESMYNQANDDIDEIAERILMVGGIPLHSYADYLTEASLRPEKGLRSADEILPVLVSNKEELLSQTRGILELAGELNDEGTLALASEFISAAEKELWMLNSQRVENSVPAV